MLRVGVTGGIGSGKSTVSHRLREHGAVVVDADQVARDVVEPGQPALARIREHFGDAVIREDGSLDRPGLAALVFPDPAQLRVLEAITGPAIAERVAGLRSSAPRASVTVFDMPLLVERGLWVREHLVVVVDAEVETRIRRLVEQRGLDETDARHRIAAQASDEQRRAAADVVLDNNGSPEDLVAAVDHLWDTRIAPWNDNLVRGERSRRPDRAAVVDPRDDWAARGRRIVAHLDASLTGLEVSGTEHIGSTAVPGLIAKDVIDVQVPVERLERADEPDFVAAMRDAGYLLVEGNTQDSPHPSDGDPDGWRKRFYASTDPGNIAHIHVREQGSAGWRFALLFRDWLRSDDAARDDYAEEKRRLLALDDRTSAYVAAKEPWFDAAVERSQAWAAATGWSPR
ncbi:dephospho-CoA kinase [Intrasporangium oryzae NRRL B-24470]|uniref:Dephospho-CoA kinase n=1 Tax=Intrasporangium oryzae NRRL B-24470 TaxID=1386089 RepID=W9GCC1_9MICO|nr:dephospho-CoA kinase [Intrasporangium oryzae]EWT02877.1 dephospho-CoA kinase [Intrasporangium oryzae NRRL B-24470]